jgi:hypothetical protein
VTRLRTWRRAEDLDRLLGAGVDPATTAELTLRAAQVTKPRKVRRLGTALVSIVVAADNPVIELGADRQAITEARSALLELTKRLRDGDVVGTRGGAMASYLVHADGSPLYRTSGRNLRNFAADASELIDAVRQGRRGFPTPL